MDLTRRDLCKGVVAAGLATTPMASLASSSDSKKTFLDLRHAPDLVRIWGGEGEIRLESRGGWQGGGVEVHYENQKLTLRASVGVTRMCLRWRGDLSSVARVLGDTWERSYADLAWRGREATRPLPWYVMAHDGAATHGYGVQTSPGAMCFWTFDNEGITLWADLHNGGSPVHLGDRTLAVCTVLCREGKAGESAFAALHAFCHEMCPNPRLADHEIYGTNDWNYAYGNNSADLIATVSGLVSELSPDTNNRPYSVIDDGWENGGDLGHGPWVGNKRFGDMGAFAQRLKGLGVRPGLWFRALTALPDQPASWRSQRANEFLDPTIPESRDHIRQHFHRFADWGYEMVKHDYTSYDLFGRFGFNMGGNITKEGWRFHDDTRTNAEIVLGLYRDIREAAGSMRLIGCNTFTHLAAGTHEAQRIGDDTSGRSWDRTRRMGVNTLAFRAAQNGAFYKVDPDIVAITRDLPWNLNEQWLNLVSHSNAALFVSVQPDYINETHKTALKSALARAAKPQTLCEPLDWMSTDCPREWRLDGKKVEFNWMGEAGANPFGD